MDQQHEHSKVMTEATLSDTLKSIKAWFRYFLSKWWLFVIIGVACGIGGIFYAIKDKAQYESRLTFSLQDNGGGGGLGGALSLASEFGFNLGGGGKDVFAGENILEIFSSRRMIQKVLLSADTLNGKPITMADEYIEFAGLKKGLLKLPRLTGISFPAGMPKEKFSYLQDSVLFLIYSDITKNSLMASKPDKKLNIFELKIKSPNERYSKLFVEMLIKETSDFYTELLSKRSKETLEILEKRVASLKGSLNSSITARAATQDANINPAFASAQAPLQKNEADIKVYGGAYAELFKNLELARYQYLNSKPLLQIIDAAEYPLKRIKLGKLKTGVIFGILGVMVIGFILIAIRLLNPPQAQTSFTNAE